MAPISPISPLSRAEVALGEKNLKASAMRFHLVGYKDAPLQIHRPPGGLSAPKCGICFGMVVCRKLFIDRTPRILSLGAAGSFGADRGFPALRRIPRSIGAELQPVCPPQELILFWGTRVVGEKKGWRLLEELEVEDSDDLSLGLGYALGVLEIRNLLVVLILPRLIP